MRVQAAHEHAHMCKKGYGTVHGPVLLLIIAVLQGRGDFGWGRLFDLFYSSGIQRTAISCFTLAQLEPSSRYQMLMVPLDNSTAGEQD